MSDLFEPPQERSSKIHRAIAVGGLIVLWLALFVDVLQWLVCLNGGFSSKANLLSHLWPYFSFGGALAGLAARGMPNILRSIPTVWLLVSLVFLLGKQMVPKVSLLPPLGATLRVMTLNLGNAQGSRPRAVSYLRQRRNVDILFLQEVHTGPGFRDRKSLEAALGGRLRHMAWFPAAPDKKHVLGLGVLSRYPLQEIRPLKLPAGEAAGKCSELAALTAKVRVRNRLVRLATAHLCPPALPWMDDWGDSTGITYRSISGWWSGMRVFEYTRRSQLDFLSTLAEGGVEPFILGGDLSTTPYSLDLRRFNGVLRSAFAERGMGFGFTYSLGFLGARIDHIFSSSGLSARSASVADVDISDHNPVEAVFEVLPTAKGKN